MTGEGSSAVAHQGTEEDQGGRPHVMQRLLDNPFLLVFIGVTMPTVLYLIWGVMEITQIPLSPS